MADQQNSMGMDAKTASWFAYVLSIISAIILLVTEKDNSRGVRTHAWQSLFLGLFFIAVYIVLEILLVVTFVWALFITLIWIAWLGFVILSVICIVKAVQGGIFKLPVIYDKVKNMK